MYRRQTPFSSLSPEHKHFFSLKMKEKKSIAVNTFQFFPSFFHFYPVNAFNIIMTQEKLPALYKCSMPHFLQLAGDIRFLAMAEQCLLHLASEGQNTAPGLTTLLSPSSASLIYAWQCLLKHHTKNSLLLWCVLSQQLAQRKTLRKMNGTKPMLSHLLRL